MLKTPGEQLDDFYMNYGYSPSGPERQATLYWAEGINDILSEVLDTKGHPQQSNGQRIRPNLATLKDIAREIKYLRGDLEKQAAIGDCFYCEGGRVYDVDKRLNIWYAVLIGKCDHCRENPGFPNLKNAEASVVTSAREWGLTCLEAVDKIVHDHNVLQEGLANIKGK
ncbi:MAG TPA: hypothetical protein ENI07_16045 [Desulfobacterales bacterium]|nr:hypothetical protein [Desulfobacterales bacterium]